MPYPPSRRACQIALVTLIASLGVVFIPSTDNAPERQRDTVPPGQPPAPAALHSIAPEPAPPSAIVRALQNGRPLRVRSAGESFGRFLFRPADAVTADFRVSLGTKAFGERAEVSAFRGRALGVAQWRAAGTSSIVRVGDQLAGHLRLPDGEVLHLRTNPDTGAGEGFLEYAKSGHRCAIDAESGIATVADADAGEPVRDPWASAFPIEIEPEPPTMASSGSNPNNGNLQFTDRPIPYGNAYRTSLKDARVLVVADKGATGSDSASNLNSKTAQYLSTISNVAALYEDQLGLRLIVHELILTPDTADYTDIAVPLSDFRSWVSSNRPRGTYSWTMALKFGEVDGALGIAYVGAAAGTSGVSINRVGSVNIPAHEMGHNMGSNHTSGGVMNPSINSSRSFFTDLENDADRTAARAIWGFMSNNGSSSQGRLAPTSRPLRHAEEIPFADDDVVTAFPNEPVRFAPLNNDDTSVRHGETNTLRLVETGSVFPTGAGETRRDGDEIVFTPAPGFDGTAWFSYTLGGDVGNGGAGWLHKGDVAVNVGRTSNPPSSAGPTGNPDFYHAGRLPLTLYPLLNDAGSGFFNLSQVAPTLGTSDLGTADPNGMYISEAVLLDTAKGNLSTQSLKVYLAGGSAVDRIRSLSFTPAAGASGPARIRYTVVDDTGTETEVIATILIGVDDEILAPGAALRYKVPTDASEDADWFTDGFDDSTWQSGTGGVGYERNTGSGSYVPLIGSDVEAEMFGIATSAYLRIPFSVSELNELSTLRLSMQYDDGFVAYLNGTEIRRRRVPEGAGWDAEADSNHEADLTEFSDYDISTHLSLLREGDNVLAIHGVNAGTSSSDMLARAKLTATRRYSSSRLIAPAVQTFAVPAGSGVSLAAEVGLATEPPFAGAPLVSWSLLERPPGGSAKFSTPSSANTEVLFTKAGRYLLRLRCAEAGYDDDRLITVFVGQPGGTLLPGVDAGLDRIVAPTSAVLSATTFPTAGGPVAWSQVEGAAATISGAGAVSFPADGTYRFRATTGDTFDEITVVSGRGRVSLVDANGMGRWAVPASADDLSDTGATPWRAVGFDDSRWDSGSAGFGYERDTGYGDFLGTTVQEAIYDNNATVLVRRPFWLPVEATQITALQFGARADDGYVAWVNDAEIARLNAPAGLPLWNSAATASNPDGAAVTLVTSLVSAPGATLIQGENVLALQVLNAGTTSSDLLMAADLSAEIEAGGAQRVRVVAPSSPGRIAFPGAGALTPGWAQAGFDDSGWSYSAAAIGYETGSGNYEHHFHTDTGDAMFEKLPGALLRIPFIIPPELSGAEIVLRARYDDAFIAYLDGTEIARSGFAGAPDGGSVADTGHPDALALAPETFAVAPALTPGPHLFAVHVMNDSITSSDLLFAPELIATTSGADPYTHYIANYFDPASASADREADPDRDGLNNALEFFLGGDASRPGGIDTPARSVAPSVLAVPGGTYEMRFWRLTGEGFVLQTSTDAETWTAIAPVGESFSPATPAYEAVALQLPAAAGTAFFRIAIDGGN